MPKFHFLIILTLLSVSALADEPEKTLTECKAAVDIAFNAALAKLSPEGQKEFKRGQQDWNKFVQKYCTAKSLHWNYETVTSCLTAQNKERAYSLENAVLVTRQGLTIRRSESFEVSIRDISDNPADGRTLLPVEVTDAWPQIDNPSNAAQREWNALMAQDHPIRGMPLEGHDCEYSHKYKIPLAGADFVSVERSDWTYCYSAPHGFGSTRSINYVLSVKRQLTDADLFTEGSGWEEVLGKLSAESLLAQKKEYLPPNFDFKKKVARVGAWGFSHDGMLIHFGEVSGYAGGDYVARIPWSQLKPYIKEGSPLQFVFEQ